MASRADGRNAPAHQYDAFFGPIVDYHAQAQVITKALRDCGATTIAEFGCGTGTMLVELAAAGFSCIGIDHDETYLTVVESKAQDGGLSISTKVADITRIPEIEPVDCVLCLRVPMEPEEISAVIRSAKAVLLPAGHLILEVPRFAVSAPHHRDGTLPNPATYLSTWSSDGAPSAKISTFRVLEDRVETSAVYLSGQHGRLAISTYSFAMWAMSESELRGALEDVGFTAIRELFVEHETVPAMDGVAVMAQLAEAATRTPE